MQLNSTHTFDKPASVLYALLLIIGFFSIYAAEYETISELQRPFWDLDTRAGKQLLWISLCVVLIVIQVFMDYRLYESFAFSFYILGIFGLIAVLFYGQEVSGSRSWLTFGGLRIQPSELVKYTTIMILAKFLSPSQCRPNQLKTQVSMLFLMGLPAVLIVWQGDTGTALVYVSLLLLLHRAGMHPTYMLIGAYLCILFVLVLFVDRIFILASIAIIALIALALVGKRPRKLAFVILSTGITISCVMGLEFAMQRVFKPYQYKRIQALIHPEADPFGFGWNVTQSKIAIGSGGFAGKGYLRGTQTKFDFVPEQTTDFIFCTIGEEFGWLGTVGVVIVFVLFILRIIQIAERQNSRFAMLYGHGVGAIFFFHFAVNIAMTIGLFPVIGIPLPFISYGGSSLLCFTLMLFTLLKLDTERKKVLPRF